MTEAAPRFAFALGRDADGFFEAMNDARLDNYNLVSVTPSMTAWLGVFEHEDVVLAREVRWALAHEAAPTTILMTVGDDGKERLQRL